MIQETKHYHLGLSNRIISISQFFGLVGKINIHEETLTDGNEYLPLYGFQWGINARYNWMPARLNPQSGEVIQVQGLINQDTGWVQFEPNVEQQIQDGFTVEGFTPRVIQHTAFEGSTPGEGLS